MEFWLSSVLGPDLGGGEQKRSPSKNAVVVAEMWDDGHGSARGLQDPIDGIAAVEVLDSRVWEQHWQRWRLCWG